MQHMTAAAARGNHGIDAVAVKHRTDTVAVAREQPRHYRDELGRNRQLLHLCAEVDRRAQVEQKPADHFAIFVVLAHVRRLHPRGNVPIDIADVVVVLIFAQIREINAEPAKKRSIVALQQSVEATDHRPL